LMTQAWNHLGLAAPLERQFAQVNLFESMPDD